MNTISVDVTTNDSEMADKECGSKTADEKGDNLILVTKEETEGVSGLSADRKDNDDQATGKKKKRGRRRRPKGGGRHHWKPYDQLNWVQRNKLEERETKRATKKREAAFQSGHPVAPYNTTQFLIEDHLKNGESMSPDLQVKMPAAADNRDDRSGDCDSESEPSFEDDSPTDELFLEKDFSEAYTNIHAEQLQNMSKSELIKEYLVLETKAELLEEQLTKFPGRLEMPSQNKNNDQYSVSSLLEEIAQLRKENDELRAESSSKANIPE